MDGVEAANRTMRAALSKLMVVAMLAVSLLAGMPVQLWAHDHGAGHGHLRSAASGGHAAHGHPDCDKQTPARQGVAVCCAHGMCAPVLATLPPPDQVVAALPPMAALPEPDESAPLHQVMPPLRPPRG